MFASNTSQVSDDANYIEDVFSTYLYTGNGSTQTITNGIDLAGKGGLVWTKDRALGLNHSLYDTVRGIYNHIATNSTVAQVYDTTGLSAFGAGGYTVLSDSKLNSSGNTYASWTFRKQPNFFDVVTYTGDAASNRAINHSLGSLPGCIIVKKINVAQNWTVWHRSFPLVGDHMYLNTTGAVVNNTVAFGTNPNTTTTFNVGAFLNALGDTYVAYVFAHNAGGFGLTGTDNVISCGSGSWSGGSDNVVNLGYEVQWLMYKSTDIAGSNWMMFDTMRGMSYSASEFLRANLADAAGTFNSPYAIYPTSTGFTVPAGSVNTGTYIYIAIRRGPMKVPTSGTSVFSPYAATTPGQAVVTTGFPVDFQMQKNAGASTDMRFVDRLRGVSTTPTSPSAAFPFLVPSGTDAESTGTGTTLNWNNTGFTVGSTYESAAKAWAVNFRRAPGFFDEVCYTGTGAATTRAHNLGVVPELMISKRRSGTAEDWYVYHAAMGAAYYMFLNLTNAKAGPNSGPWNSTAPTSSVFSTGDWYESGATYVTYLFASCPGVSKVGSVTHVEPTTVVCGFTPRFVMLKSTATTGTDDWFVFDSARGITSGNDPYLRLNSTGAENTPFGAADLIDPTADGFIMNGFSGGNYIYLAIA